MIFQVFPTWLAETLLPAAVAAGPAVTETDVKPAGSVRSNCAEATDAAPGTIETGILTCVPAWPEAVPIVMRGAPDAAPMVRVRLFEPAPVALVTMIVTLDVPVAVGVPEMSPLVAFTLKPAGSPVAP